MEKKSNRFPKWSLHGPRERIPAGWWPREGVRDSNTQSLGLGGPTPRAFDCPRWNLQNLGNYRNESNNSTVADGFELCWIIFSQKKSRFGLSKCEIRCGLGMSGPQSLMQHRSVKWLVSFRVSKACNQAALAAAFNCHGTNHHAMRPDWIIHLQDAWPRAPPEHSPASLPGIDA